MSAPRTKRQFAGASADPAQRQITSFFNTHSASTPSEAPVAASGEVRQPALPSTVQSNLLSVGMRVRKSVPEGYKTMGTSAFKLWTDNAPLPASVAAIRSPAPKGAARELLPFCGINKVGGLASQPAFDRDHEVPDLDAVPELTMSQESAEAQDASRKRIFDEDEDVEDDFITSPARFATPGSDADRVMAVPRVKSKKNVTFQNINGTDSDFEEADFLVFGEGREGEA